MLDVEAAQVVEPQRLVGTPSTSTTLLIPNAFFQGRQPVQLGERRPASAFTPGLQRRSVMPQTRTCGRRGSWHRPPSAMPTILPVSHQLVDPILATTRLGADQVGQLGDHDALAATGDPFTELDRRLGPDPETSHDRSRTPRRSPSSTTTPPEGKSGPGNRAFMRSATFGLGRRFFMTNSMAA